MKLGCLTKPHLLFLKDGDVTGRKGFTLAGCPLREGLPLSGEASSKYAPRSCSKDTAV